MTQPPPASHSPSSWQARRRQRPSWQAAFGGGHSPRATGARFAALAGRALHQWIRARSLRATRRRTATLRAHAPCALSVGPASHAVPECVRVLAVRRGAGALIVGQALSAGAKGERCTERALHAGAARGGRGTIHVAHAFGANALIADARALGVNARGGQLERLTAHAISFGRKRLRRAVASGHTAASTTRSVGVGWSGDRHCRSAGPGGRRPSGNQADLWHPPALTLRLPAVAAAARLARRVPPPAPPLPPAGVPLVPPLASSLPTPCRCWRCHRRVGGRRRSGCASRA